jgi:hypothetical protein
VSAVALAYFRDQPMRDDPIEMHALRFEDVSTRVLWEACRDEVLADWIREHPGTRPSCWWRFDAPRWLDDGHPGWYFHNKLPEPRRRLGGVGTPSYEVLRYVPSFRFGLPDRWVEPSQVEYYNGRSKDIHGTPIGTQYSEGHFSGVAIDWSDPPRFESQAAYLNRHGLLAPAERRRLTPADFEPVTLHQSRPRMPEAPPPRGGEPTEPARAG